MIKVQRQNQNHCSSPDHPLTVPPQCSTDWITIPCATNTNDPSTQSGTPVVCVDRICGQVVTILILISRLLKSKLNRGACYKLKPGLPKCSKPSRCSTRPPLHLPPLQCLFSVSFCQLSFSDQSIIFSVFKVSQSLSTFMSTRILWRAVPAQPKPTTGETYFQNKNYFQNIFFKTKI